jgi:hypothetical protein
MRRFRIFGVVGVVAMVFAAVSYADKGEKSSRAVPAAGSTAPAQTQEATLPLQLALVPQFQLVHEDTSIQGFRLNIYGRNQNVSGVDIGLVHETKRDFKGVAFGLINIVHGEGRGLQFSGLYTETTTRMAGLQVGMVNRSNNMHGIQIGLANFADDMTGFQFGLWNEIKNKEQWNVIPFINAAF